MIKKIILTSCIIIPTIAVTTFLLVNKPSDQTSSTIPIDTSKYKQKTLNIEGMHCDACAQTITDAINICEKVKDVSVSFDTQKATFSYHPDDCSIDDIKNNIIEAGYTIKPNNSLKIIDYRIKYN